MNTAGIVLAGGQSRRFGEPKALALWQGQSFLSYSIAAIEPHTKEIIVISHLPEVASLPYIVRGDIEEYEGMGPLAGLLTGMTAIEAEWYMVLPCDVPLVTSETVAGLLSNRQEEVDAVVPIIDGRVQPLLACYHERVKERLRSLLDEGKRSMQSLLAECSVLYVDEERLKQHKQAFQNVNTQEEYRNLP